MPGVLRRPQVLQTVQRRCGPAVHLSPKTVKRGGGLMDLFTGPLSRREQLSQQSEGEMLRKYS